MTTTTAASTYIYVITQLNAIGSVFLPDFAYEAMTTPQRQAVQALRAAIDGCIYCL